jgi:hypothetical protein
MVKRAMPTYVKGERKGLEWDDGKGSLIFRELINYGMC